MTNEHFNAFLARSIEQAQNTMINKGNEYSTEYDRFTNFKRANLIQSLVTVQTPAAAAFKFMAKQLISCVDIINGVVPYNKAFLAEKFGDIRNYLWLIEGMLLEAIEPNEQVNNIEKNYSYLTDMLLAIKEKNEQVNNSGIDRI